ncbi:hypothetical protein FOZ63_031497 [Perkinsus olseni]|uniref:Uncharacterized protein n=1 Tax=Perkinsus olseni TaxID=32597 RepID=A0A7J6RUP9_PEROL|nr:hypothetical protein FOZ63_031497 [Perkinsus olseni]
MAEQLAAWAKDQAPVGSISSREDTVDFLHHSLSVTTVDSYRTARKGYEAMGLSFPISRDQLCFYIRGMCAASDVSGSTLRKYVSGLKSVNDLLGYPCLSPEDWGIVKRALTAADNVIGPRETNQAAIIPEDVSKFLFETRGSFFGKLEAARDAVLTGICLGLRPGELLGIRARDIHCAFGSMDLLVTVNLGKTKTRRLERVEVSCRLTTTACTATGVWCAAHRLQHLRARTIPDMRIFHKIATSFSASVRELVGYLPPRIPQHSRDQFLQFTGHSCRRTSATYQLRSDVPRAQIKRNCRWRTDGMIDVYTSEELGLTSRNAAAEVRNHACSTSSTHR